MRDKCKGATCNRCVSQSEYFESFEVFKSTDSTPWGHFLTGTSAPPTAYTATLKCGARSTTTWYVSQLRLHALACRTCMFFQLVSVFFSPSRFFQQSSICRAAIHYGVIDDNGGLVEVARKDNFPFFVKATKNGVESLRYESLSDSHVFAVLYRALQFTELYDKFNTESWL